MAILGPMDTDTDISIYSLEVNKFAQWCDNHHVIGNVKKTEENIVDPGRRSLFTTGPWWL